MPYLNKLFGAAALGTSVGQAFWVRRLISRVITIGILMVMSGILLALLVAAVLYLTYFGLVHYGLDSQIALIVTGGLLLLITLLAVGLMIFHLRSLQDSLHLFLSLRVPLISNLGSFIAAFLEGFHSIKPGKERR